MRGARPRALLPPDVMGRVACFLDRDLTTNNSTEEAFMLAHDADARQAGVLVPARQPLLSAMKREGLPRSEQQKVLAMRAEVSLRTGVDERWRRPRGAPVFGKRRRTC